MFRSEFVDRSISVFALVTVLLATSLVAARGLNFGADFAGGMLIEVHFPEAARAESVRDKLVRAGLADASVIVGADRSVDVTGYPSYAIIELPARKGDLTPEQVQQLALQVIAALDTEQRHVEVRSVEVVTQKVGRELLLLGAAPLLLVCAGIMIHPAVRYGWRFALSIGMANFRNVTIILGLFLSAYTIFDWEFSLPTLAAMTGLVILTTGVGAVRASRGSR